ncbi:MAG TPA: hypothetical protein DGP39_07005 [Verrucomicrobiales bacterium]|nr:hypothetical protein [Verrucomicrobiales bacterium]
MVHQFVWTNARAATGEIQLRKRKKPHQKMNNLRWPNPSETKKAALGQKHRKAPPPQGGYQSFSRALAGPFEGQCLW